MNDEMRFPAPWSLSVKIITGVTLGLLSAATFLAWRLLPANTPPFARLLAMAAPPAILLFTLPFAVRGYVLRNDELRIERLGWFHRVPLSAVLSVTADPDAVRGSIRICGSGGLFGFFGWFRNRKLGVYRAHGTDPALAVVVKLPHRNLVVTPADPNRFVLELQARLDAP